MRTMCFGLAVWAVLGMAAGAAEVVIESFDMPGKITFGKLENAAAYRVEWASAAGGAWTSFTAAAASLDTIVSPGLGTVTAAVPMLYRVVATMAPEGMVLIPAGSFVMGDTFGEGESDELPLHTNYISAFYMGRYEVTKGEWDEVYAWAIANGYGFDYAGSGKAANHPVQAITWYDVVKWCNARSQKEGRMAAYYTSAAMTTVYKTGQTNVANDWVKWTDGGYRLPTEAEWEKAARGGAANMRFPWTDYTNKISHAKANYNGSTNDSYDLSIGYHPAYATGGFPYTSPVGVFAPNGYILYDMAGNVREWCWDWYDGSYYAASPGTDPRGPASSPYSARVYRDSGWDSRAKFVRCANRGDMWPNIEFYHLGFRLARSVGP